MLNSKEKVCEKSTLEQDMWGRDSIPIFNGHERAREGWEAAFIACID